MTDTPHTPHHEEGFHHHNIPENAPSKKGVSYMTFFIVILVVIFGVFFLSRAITSMTKNGAGSGQLIGDL